MTTTKLIHPYPYTQRKINMVNALVILVIIIFTSLTVLALPAEAQTTGWFYAAVIISSVFLAWLAQPKKGDRLRLIPFWLSFLILFFVLGFRNISGIDDPEYVRMFNSILSMGFFSYFLYTNIEPGYILLNLMLGLFTHEYLIVQGVCTFIPMFLLYKGFERYRNSISIPLSVLLLISTLYFQMLSTSLVRMFIAIGIVFYAIGFIWNYRPVKYFLMICAAGLFHYSALIMLLFVVLALREHYIRLYWKRICVISIIVMLLTTIVLTQIIIPTFGWGRHAEYEWDFRGVSFSAINSMFIFVFCIIFIRIIPHEQRRIYICGLLLLFVTVIVTFFGAFGRVIFYTNLGLLICLPMAYKYSENTFTRLIIGGFSISFSFLYLFFTQWNLESKIPHLFPYQNIYFQI